MSATGRNAGTAAPPRGRAGLCLDWRLDALAWLIAGPVLYLVLDVQPLTLVWLALGYEAVQLVLRRASRWLISRRPAA